MSNIIRIVGDSDQAPRIFCFVDGGHDGWWNVVALSQDGDALGGHLCSHPSFGPHDMGCLYDCDAKHDRYRERYPDGYVVEWVDGQPLAEEPIEDARIASAYTAYLMKQGAREGDETHAA